MGDDKTMRTKFEASLFNLPKMRNDAENIARDMGFSKKGDIDAYRHAYTSAKMQEAFGGKIANTLGNANEVGRDFYTKIVSLGTKGNPSNDWDMDVYNNFVGRKIESKLEELRLSSEIKERQLRQAIAEAVRSNILQTVPSTQSPQEGFVERHMKEGLNVGYGSSPVAVGGYTRNGQSVRAHTRTLPDADVTNNLSYGKRQ